MHRETRKLGSLPFNDSPPNPFKSRPPEDDGMKFPQLDASYTRPSYTKRREELCSADVRDLFPGVICQDCSVYTYKQLNEAEESCCLVDSILKCASSVQPQIGIYSGFLDICSARKNFDETQIMVQFINGTHKSKVNNGNLITGQPYTLGIHMDDTDRYDYLLQSCIYNDKYRFVDQNSCLVCDKFFLQMWENDMYRLRGATKRTFIHFVPPEPLTRLECTMLILHCCGCAERACERKILPTLITYPQQLINLTIINDHAVELFGTSVANWPWWPWLLIVLGLVLLLCLLSLLLLLYSQLQMHKRKVSDSRATMPPATPAKVPNILVRAKEMEANGSSERQSVPPSARILLRTPSDSPSESIHSTASESRIAVVIKQQQPRTSWADHSIRSEVESRPTLRRHMGACHLESVIEERRDSGEFEQTTGPGNKFQSSSDGYCVGMITPEKTILHQQIAYEEKFFKKSDSQNRILEEGYDRAQLTRTAVGRDFFNSEVV
ncbi:unnamed protein product [Litomosoides sigmodontis]|uniref:ZP domain-containing protein n=1 Tax=Litomosoides sigmodontis TaxID=42156 RepID=A0A3P6UTG0_LITSI|nr:unnamed protein product [Litomosoides sigmodontis]